MAKTTKKKWMMITASVSGEMKPDDIPPAPGVDVEALKEGDDAPLEVVVEIPAGKSTRGWNYRPSSLQAIVDHVNRHTLSGFLGHQKPDEVANRFEDPVTHWIGAKMVGETAYFRGIVDAAAKNLKRWIRTKRIKQVSIFGYPQLQTAAGETDVIGYQPLSIDWTPLDRSGMPTRIVAMGEMDEPNEGGLDTMDWKELLAQIQTQIQAGDVTLQEVTAALDPEGNKKASDALELIEKIKDTLSLSADADVLAAIEEVQKAANEAKKADQRSQVDEVVKEKVSGEMAQALILKMVSAKPGSTREMIVGEIDSLLADSTVKEMISRLHTDSPSITGGAGSSTATKTKRVSI